ncbi:NUDIX hydrolase [Paracoccus sp. Z330]|uniref:NUDIX hydrolase n=1 Tax=Paracoccus onchidii TaxID=3017813 RepID=A0ABT4ZBR9_9RHOB|nr:NUDIX hydrolase [Paracoccus onchidii]MDB6176812.1 NUDIX hydrolase [Paracoccus onchidii]
MIPRFGERPQPGLRYRHRPGVYAVLVRDNRILLTHQAFPIPEFQLPGGGVESGESLVAALHREVFEETGWRIGNLRGLGRFRRFCDLPEHDMLAEKMCHIWIARPILRLAPPPEQGHTACWFRPAEALELIADPGARHWLGRYLRG